MINILNNINQARDKNSKNIILSRFLLITEKLIGFLFTAYIAYKISYSDIGFWSQIIYFSNNTFYFSRNNN